MPSLADKIKGMVKPELTEPFWKGPEVDGVTQSLLGKYLTCKERCRVYVMEGLIPHPTFSHRMEFGNLWHVCEENYNGDWQEQLLINAKALACQYPLSNASGQIDTIYQLCKLEFPIYLKYWEENLNEKSRVSVAKEIIFRTGENGIKEYKLASGRIVTLRGKLDGIEQIGVGKEKAIWLGENKAKGEIDEQLIKRQLSFDLQTMMYLTVMEMMPDEMTGRKQKGSRLHIAGVRYHTVRRPLSGGKHSIQQKKGRDTKEGLKGAESLRDFYDRLAGLIIDNPDYFFMRWPVTVDSQDLIKFADTCLDPVLENLCDDYEWWSYCMRKDTDPFQTFTREKEFPHHSPRHFRMPYGVYNPLLEGGSSEYDDYLLNGNRSGLTRTDSLFKELAA